MTTFAITLTGKLSPPESPVGPPHIYHKQDPERQKEFPAVYYDISNAISPSQQGPLAVVWAVEYNAREEYYAQVSLFVCTHQKE